ncbi:UPF0175 family protein [Metabacillus sp. RGM 3146]|uniref:UPF0175 family protein n=1 Tax=Metabacillus sp. RGM 3146 TaxID=3401092 RepID=UPI003B9C5ECE
MIREKLKNFSNGQAVEQSIYTSIAVSLFISNQISLEEGAHLADMIFTDFIYFLDLHNVPWSIGLKDGSEDYQKSVDHLIDFVDNILENEEKEVFLI